jgi:hypothetical protein
VDDTATEREFRTGDPCLECGRKPARRALRGLDSACYARHRRAGTLDAYPLLGDGRPKLRTGPLGDVDGLTYRQLDYWIRAGYLLPNDAGAGAGSRRSWSDSERAVAVMMARLVAAGLTLEAAHRVARAGGRLELAPGVTVEVASG